MSALDQAFIKVFKQDAQKSAAAQAGSMAAPRATSTAPSDTHEAIHPASQRATATSQATPPVDSLYADGAFYRDADAGDPFPQPAAVPHARSRRNKAALSTGPGRVELADQGASRWSVDRAATAPDNFTGSRRETGANNRHQPAAEVTHPPAAEAAGRPTVAATPYPIDRNQDSPAMQWVFATETAAESCQVLVETGPLDAAQITDTDGHDNLLDMDWLDEQLLSLQLQTRPSAKAIAPQSVAAKHIADERIAIPPIDLEASMPEPIALEAVEPEAVEPEAVEPEAVEPEPASSQAEGPDVTTAADANMVAGDAAEIAWEVDRLQWPAVCDQLYQARKAHFDHCGAKLLAATREGLRVLAVSSSERGEGRTTLALCLARAAAAAGVRVALMEADFGHVSLGSLLRVDTPCDWPHAVRNQLPWTEAAIWSVEDQITLLPLSDEDNLTPIRLNDPLLTQLIADLRNDFDLLVIDSPPIGDAHSEFFQAGDSCPIDAAILVRDQRVAVADHTLRIVERIRDAGVEAVGIAHNYSKLPTE